MFPCLCAQGSSIAEYLDFSRIAVKVKETLVCLCACTPCEAYFLSGWAPKSVHFLAISWLQESHPPVRKIYSNLLAGNSGESGRFYGMLYEYRRRPLRAVNGGGCLAQGRIQLSFRPSPEKRAQLKWSLQDFQGAFSEGEEPWRVLVWGQ